MFTYGYINIDHSLHNIQRWYIDCSLLNVPEDRLPHIQQLVSYWCFYSKPCRHYDCGGPSIGATMGRTWSHLGTGLHICKRRCSLFENNSLYNHSDQLHCALCTQVAKAILRGKKHYTDVLKNQQQVAQDNSKENAQSAGFVTLWEASPIATASNKESVSMWWRHRCVCTCQWESMSVHALLWRMCWLRHCSAEWCNVMLYWTAAIFDKLNFRHIGPPSCRWHFSNASLKVNVNIVISMDFFLRAASGSNQPLFRVNQRYNQVRCRIYALPALQATRRNVTKQQWLYKQHVDYVFIAIITYIFAFSKRDLEGPL